MRKSNSNTPLSIMCRILKENGIIPNQTVFYNCLFEITTRIDYLLDEEDSDKEYYPRSFINRLKKELMNIYCQCVKEKSEFDNKIHYKRSLERNNTACDKRFYSAITGDFSLSHFPSFVGLENNERKPNISKVINGNRNIPKFWTECFSIFYSYKEILNFVIPLSYILQYLLVFQYVERGKYRNDEPLNDTKYMDYEEFFSYDEDTFRKVENMIRDTQLYENEIKNIIDNHIRSLADISLIVFYAIFRQSVLKEKLDYGMIEKVPIVSFPDNKKLAEQYDLYFRRVDCYGTKSIDRFNALNRYADTNVYCACELGSAYYYGEEYYSGEGKYYLDRDYSKAAEYYKKCCNEPVLATGCWSLGYLILNRIFRLSDKERLEKAEEYFLKCGKYGPARNSLALIEKERGDNLLNELIERNSCSFKDLSDENKERIVGHYINFFKYTVEATEEEWLYAYNNQYGFFANDKYEQICPYLEPILLKYGISKWTMLAKAAELKNPWAMDRLAVIILDHKQVVDPDIVQRVDPKRLFEEADSLGYSRSTFHLATYFYKNDEKLYFKYIKAAADNGELDAYVELKKLTRNIKGIKWDDSEN